MADDAGMNNYGGGIGANFQANLNDPQGYPNQGMPQYHHNPLFQLDPNQPNHVPYIPYHPYPNPFLPYLQTSNVSQVLPQEPNHLNQPQMQENHEPPPQRAICDYIRPVVDAYVYPKGRPRVNAENFEIKPALITMIKNDQFGGASSEDPYVHLENFLDYCDTVKYEGVPEEAIMLRLFPFSLKDGARVWYQGLTSKEKSTWKNVTTVFLEKFFPQSRVMEFQRLISAFNMNEEETLYDGWERYKHLLRRCPQHGFNDWQQVHIFYKGLTSYWQDLLDAAASTSLLSKTPNEAWEIITSMAANRTESPGRGKKNHFKEEVHENKEMECLKTQVNLLKKIVEELTHEKERKTATVAAIVQNPICSLCHGPHASEACHLLLAPEEVHHVGCQKREDPNLYLNNYNFGQVQNQASSCERKHEKELPTTSQSQVIPSVFDASRMDRLEELMERQIQVIGKQNELIGILQQQVTQLNTEVQKRSLCSGPSVSNSKVQTQDNVIEEEVEKAKLPATELTTEKEKMVLDVIQEEEQLSDREKFQRELEIVKNFEPLIPYPTRLPPGEERVKECERTFGPVGVFQAQLSKLESAQKPAPPPSNSWGEFLDDVMLRKKRATEDVVWLPASCHAVHDIKDAVKQYDPGSITIPCRVNGHPVENALCDLGAGVNVLPYELYREWKLGGLKPVSITISFADRSTRRPLGMIEDAMVIVGNFAYPTDFIVLDIPKDAGVPIILGRPFLATCRALIDLANQAITLKLLNAKITFEMGKQVTQPKSTVEKGSNSYSNISSIYCFKTPQEDNHKSMLFDDRKCPVKKRRKAKMKGKAPEGVRKAGKNLTKKLYDAWTWRKKPKDDVNENELVDKGKFI